MTRMTRHFNKVRQCRLNDCSMASKSSVEGAEGVGDVVMITVNRPAASLDKFGIKTMSYDNLSDMCKSRIG